MIRNFCRGVCNNKNLLMLFSVGIYILSLYATLSGLVLPIASLLTLLFVISIFKEYLPIKYIIVWVLIFYIGVCNILLREKETDFLYNLAPQNAVISGKIVSIPDIKTSNKIQFFVQADSINYDGIDKNLNKDKLLVSITTDKKLKRFETYKIKGRLIIPFKAGNPCQFDYGKYLHNFGVSTVFYGKEIERIETTLSKKEIFLQKINEYREKILNIHSRYLASPNIEILGGIVFGDDAVSTPEEVKQSFISSGLLHILAASGMNVAFIFSFFFLIFSCFKINYKINITLGIFTIILYSMMTGLGASIIRATLMLVFVLIGKLLDRDAHSVSLLSFVAFLMLIYNPMYINDVGFQLSFLVTFGLLIMTPNIVRTKNKILNWGIGVICIPLIAQLWVIPIQMFYFNNVSLYSVFANIMSVPILAIVSFGGFVSSLLSIISPIADVVCRVFDIFLNPLITILVKISDFWGGLPNATHTTSQPTILQIILYYIILLLFSAYFSKEIREKYRQLIKYSFIFFVISLGLTLFSIPNKNLEITAFDVGNADAFLIKTPDNKYVMIDTGKSGYNGGKSQAEFIILKYLKNKGIKNIDSLILTHFDNDHCGGAVDIINSLNVKQVYVNDIKHSSIAARDIFNTARAKSITVLEAQNKQNVYDNDNLIITNFISKKNLEKDDNESSIVTLLEYRHFKMLFTGDAGEKTLIELQKYLPQNINILKVGHHGAFGVLNKNLASYFNPEFAIISVGQNIFGHPSDYTLNLLKNTKILRTDINNSIRIIVNGNNYKTQTYFPEKKKYITIN